MNYNSFFIKAINPIASNEKKVQFEKLAKRLDIKAKTHQSRIELMQKKIDDKMLLTHDKYQIRKSKILQSYEYKSTAIKQYYLKKINLNERKCQKRQTQKPRYYHYYLRKFQAKKLLLIDFSQKDKMVLLQQHNMENENLERWFHEKLKNYQWDFHNFVINYQKHRDDYYSNSIYKINYYFDKRLFYYEFYKQRKWLKTIKQKFDNQAIRKECDRRKRQLIFDLVNKYKLTYLPFSSFILQKWHKLKNYYNLIPIKIKNKFHDLSYLTFKDILRIKLFEVPILIYFACMVIITLALVFNALAVESMGAIALLFVIAILGGELLNRTPVWKTYLGGGTMGVFFVGAILGTFNLIPEAINSQVKSWFVDAGFLNLYINILIVGSILTIHQKLILRSFTGFICLLIASASIAVVGTYLLSSLLGLSWKLTVLQIILPLLSDGNGGGVQPLSAMSQSYHYLPYHEYMSFALAVSTVSNIFVIIIAAVLTTFFSKSPSWSGNGKLIKKPIYLREQLKTANDRQVAAALFLSCTIYVLAKMLETVLIKTLHININAFAWAVVISLMINLCNVLPKGLKAGCYRLNQFFSKQFTWILMVAIGLTMTNLKIFASLFTNWKALSIILVMDLLLMVGPLIVARLINFYALESMVAAGCCLGAQGGAGSLAVLGAAKRIELLPYSQITCRIGGGLVLILAAPIFLWFQSPMSPQ